MEQNREAMYDSNAFAGGAVGTDSPEPSSPITRHGHGHHGPHGQDSSGYDSSGHQGQAMGAGSHQPGYRIQSNASLGAYGSGTVVSRPVSFGLGGGNSQMPLHTGSAMSVTSDMRLLPPEISNHNLQSGLEHGEDSSSQFEGAFASNERSVQPAAHVAVSNMDLGSSSSEEVTSPIIRRESDILATANTQQGPRDSKPVPAALPAQIEMSSIFNQSQQHQSILRGFHNHGSSRSLFESNMNRRSGYQNRSKGDLPSVLMSIMRQENIDYENDFYWMTQFHAERLRDPAGVERSLMHSPRGGFGGLGYSRARRSVSGGVGSSSVIGGGFMSPLRGGMSRHSTPPFAAEHEHQQPFSPGMNSSAMGAASGMYLSNLPPGQHGQQGYHGHHQHMSDHSASTAGLPDQDSPRFTYGSGSGGSNSGGSHNMAGGGVPVTPTSTPVPATMPAPGLNWGSPSSSEGGFVQHATGHTGAGPSAGTFTRRPHGPPAAGQKKSVSGLDCLNENDAEEC